MATLTINGRDVQVDDSFLKLSPADQEKTVNEIAGQMGIGAGATTKPAAQPASGADIMRSLPWQTQAGFMAQDFGANALDAIPILGGMATQLTDKFAPGYTQGKALLDQSYPAAAASGQVAGAVAPFVAGGAIPAAAKVMGLDATMPLLPRTIASALSNSGIAAADAYTRGGSPADIARSAEIGGITGAALPGVGVVAGKAANALGRVLGRGAEALTNTDRAAQRVVAGAAAQDVRMGQALGPLDEANAVLNGQPLLNADRFGGNIRSLARTAKNMAPDAGAMLDEATQQRFLTQGDRASQFVRRITGGNVNDLALQDQIQQAARQSNDAAYGRAYADPNASAIWTPQIRQLMQSPDVLAAIRGADRTAANDAALTGKPAVRNPFTFTTKPDGSVSVGLRTNPDGSRALPNLQFWDIVQRNLRRAAEVADRTPNGKADASTLRQLRSQLLNNLDQAVPSFGAARAGAAAAFGAEDALDAGRKFVTQQMAIPEAKAAYAKFTPAERKAFATGFASSLIDKIGAARDNVNVINQVFGSPAARAQVELALGKSAASQLEQFVRVENVMQMTKQAVQGNSSTAKQLIAAGVVGGGLGGYFGGWDPRNMATGAGLMMAGRAGMRALGKTVDQKIMQRVADILASGDPEAISKEILNASLSGQHADAIKVIERGLQISGEAAALQATRPQALN